MDGRIVTAVLTLLAPSVGIGVTVAYFGANPLSILGLITVMIVGSIYLLSYADSF
jgi:hypothetical protein